MVARHPPLNSSDNPFTQVNRIGTHAIQYTKLGSRFLPDAVGVESKHNRLLSLVHSGEPKVFAQRCAAAVLRERWAYPGM